MDKVIRHHHHYTLLSKYRLRYSLLCVILPCEESQTGQKPFSA